MTYDEALPSLFRSLDELGDRRPTEILALRTIKGTFALVTREAAKGELKAALESLLSSLGIWANPEGQRLFAADDLAMLGDVFASPELMHYAPPESAWELPVLHRLVTGAEWIDGGEAERSPNLPPRIVFYGVKGGVGRSTALAVSAFHLARNGKNVLLVDLDLESPGLSGILLPPDTAWARAKYGIVDYLVETAVDPHFSEWRDLVARSPLENSPSVTGTISIVAAGGAESLNYLEKLSRAYIDIQGADGEIAGFAGRIEKMLDKLVANLDPQPDVVLIDSRSGLHDIAAACLVRLADLGLLFATDAPQTWEDYRILFDHWAKSPDTVRAIRERLQIVRAMTPIGKPDSSDFAAKAFKLFQGVYDELEPGELGADAFSFAVEDSEAPHSPWMIRFNSDLLEFDPVKDMGTLGPDFVLSLHDDFLRNLMLWLDGHEPV
jgi:hypothetical protein